MKGDHCFSRWINQSKSSVSKMIQSMGCFLFYASSVSSSLLAAENVQPQVLGRPSRVYHLESTIQSDCLQIRTLGDGIATLQWSIDQSYGPHVLEFRLKSNHSVDLGDYYVKWIDAESERRHSFECIPIIPDGEWHKYRLPLGNHSKIQAFQITFGNVPHELKICDVTLTPVSPKENSNSKQQVEVESDRLKLRFEPSSRNLKILDKSTQREWVSDRISKWLSIIEARQISESAFNLKLWDHFANSYLHCEITLQDGDCHFHLHPENPGQRMEAARRFPPFFTTSMADGQLVFCNRSGGTIIPQTDPSHSHWPLRVYGNTHCLDMPWIGLFDQEQRDGVMLLVDSPFDAEVALVKDIKGRYWPQVHWLPERDRFSYPRHVSYRFQSEGGYLGMAKAYRKVLEHQGRIKTLKQKLVDKPQLERLKGAPSLWGWPKTQEFIDSTRPFGVMRGIVNSCEDPQLVRQLHKDGYLTGAYDNYSDFHTGPVNFQSDDPQLSAVMARPGADPKRGWKPRDGQTLYWRSSAQWKRAEDSYVDQHLKHTGHTSRFIDVAAAMTLSEDYHPEHPMSRRDDYQNRFKLFQRMNQRKVVLGAEHGNDWVMPEVDFLEGAMSGPHWWSSWPAGHLDTPSREQLSPKYLKYGMGEKHRIPLWELVYHDCAISTWYWGDTAGILHQSAPEIADRKDLFNILYGTPPLIWMNNTGYRYPEQIDRMLKTYHDTTHLHALVAFSEMVDHQFLSNDRSVQKTRFSNGVEVTVNFSDQARDAAVSSGKIRLAPLGFYVDAPVFHQSRLAINNSIQTVISKPGFLLVESDGKSPLKNVQFPGRFTAFQSDDNQWNVLCDRGGKCIVNASAITGWDATDQLTLFTMNPDGTPGVKVITADWQGTAEFLVEDDSRGFVIRRLRTNPNQLSIQEKKSGFQQLFNGTDLRDWQHSGNWTVEEGAIFRKENGGFLTYGPEAVPDDFELRFEWKVASGSNSGVHYRPTQYEYQILDNLAHRDGKNPRTSAGSLYFCMAPSQIVTRPVGQWNTGRVVCQGTVIQHWLNGHKIVHFDYKNPKWSDEVNLLNRLGGDLTARGQHLALQDHLDPVWFRAIRIRKLAPDERIDQTEVTPMEVSLENRQKEEAIIQWRLQNLLKSQSKEEFKDE